MDYDYLVICTGATQTLNEKDKDSLNQIVTQEQRTEFLNRYKLDIKYSNSVLLVGSGLSVVDFCTNLIHEYGSDKKLGIMWESDNVLPDLPVTVQRKAMNYFESRGVTIHTNCKLSSKKEIAESYDYILKWDQPECYAPFMKNNNFRKCKDEGDRIFVNEYFQVNNWFF